SGNKLKLISVKSEFLICSIKVESDTSSTIESSHEEVIVMIDNNTK
ncbi:MAG: hypothetical protein ISR00_06515, partial [Flavobacteriales bacterium]|nr:hypothetical protein [Flavobacteriales bacterium]